MASTRVTKVYTNTGDRRTYTVSAWVKRNKLGATQDVISAYRSTDGLQTDVMRFPSDDTFQFYMHSTNSAGNCELKTNRKFRDTNAWYHIVTRVDTTQSTNTNRVRIYINGVQETSFATENYMNQDGEGVWGIGASHTTHTIGAVGTSNYFDGCVSHVHYADGQSLAPTVFGSTDSTTGEWKINTSPSFTLGSNGFTILKDGNTVTDQSTNSNDFSVTAGTLTKTEDNPSNVFATLNPLVNNYGEMMTLTQGNLTCESTTSSPAWKTAVSTLGMTSGKYYWEVKFVNVHNAYNTGVMGSNVLTANAQNPMNQNGWTGFYNYDGGEIRKDGNLTTNDYGTYSTNDIMGVACDMDNYTISFYKNGVAHVSNASLSTTGRDVVFPASCHYQTNGGAQATYNFGNGYFGTTAVSSAGTNASGIGIFEYDVPTGYTALSTKGLNL